MITYVPASNRIIHYTYVDFSNRNIVRPIYLVQYDDKIPIIAVALYNNGAKYLVPTGASVNIRLGKPDGTFVYNPALGYDSTKQIVYFEVTQQMVILNGDIKPIIEVVIGSDIAGSSPIYFIVNKNPIQVKSIESTTEFKTGQEYALEAIDAAARAAISESKAKTSETNAKDSEIAANNSAQQANAAYQEIVASDIGTLESSLFNNRVYQPLNDSTGANILDSSGNIIQGQVIFVNSLDFINLQNKVTAFEVLFNRLNSLLLDKRLLTIENGSLVAIDSKFLTIDSEIVEIKSDHLYLSNHALLDDLYEEE